MRWRIGVWTLALVAGLAATGVAQEPGAPQNAPQGGQQQSPAPKSDKPGRIRVGGNVEAPKVISAPQPVYPPLARQAGIQGYVVLHAVITKEGDVTELSVISGPPQLVQAALDAVRQWKYETTLLNGEPVEVEMTITVRFAIGITMRTLQAPPAGESPAPGTWEEQSLRVDPQLKADILHLFEVMRVRELMGTTIQATLGDARPKMLASLPVTPNRDKILDSYVEKMTSMMQSDEYLDAAAAVYAKYLSDDDVKALAAFYETPAGQHYNAATSKILAGSVQVGKELMREHIPQILKSLCDEYPELQGEAKFCPKVEPGAGNQSLLREPGRVPLSGAAQ